jgi:hypothetical protein
MPSYEFTCCGEDAVFTRETAADNLDDPDACKEGGRLKPSSDGKPHQWCRVTWVDDESFQQPASGTVAGENCGSEYNREWLYALLGSLGGVLALFGLCVFAVARSPKPDGAVKYLPRPLTSCIFRCLVRCGCHNGRFRGVGATSGQGAGGGGMGGAQLQAQMQAQMQAMQGVGAGAGLAGGAPYVATGQVILEQTMERDPAEKSIVEKLSELTALRDAGALDDDEFKAAKAQLLAK